MFVLKFILKFMGKNKKLKNKKAYEKFISHKHFYEFF